MRGFACFVLGCLVSLGWCTPDIMNSMHAAAEIGTTSKLTAMKCMLCHTNPPKRNVFGRDVEEAIETVKPELMTKALWHELALKDSDGDGVSNGNEVSAGTAPGNATDKPTSNPGATDGGLIPKHSFHPLYVHFPIALVLFGVVLELFGYRKRDSGLRRAGWLGLLWGTIFIVPTAFTGLRASFQLGMKWEGQFLTHFICAVAALILCTGTVLWRRKGEVESSAYFGLLILAGLAVAATGHFGAMLVFG
ncbi:MAG: hypothetical protein IT206_07440 [Fimbriimonadaceae bacterium]|nr:hypothetical protein [Fimbriimonadaceae bacterium]